LATLKEIKTRIGAIKSTQKITKAMKMVAASKLRKAQDKIISTRPYANKMNELLSQLILFAEKTINPLMEEREIQNHLAVVISSDRGLCGSFNTNLLRFATERINELGEDTRIITIGKKADDYFKKRGYNVIQSNINIFGDLKIELARDIVKSIVQGYLEKEYENVELIFNEFKSIIKQSTVAERFLPLSKPDTEQVEKTQSMIDYIYEPSASKILNFLIPKQLDIQLLKALFESNAAEQGARMTAMEMATNNATGILRDLELIYNRVRQESITKELLEIVAGAEALRES
jgi:F-type H+-transporting ATPase subunit gamma